MATKKGSKLYNQFVKGLITEANALTFPENASYDELNFELLRDGSRRRRRGLQVVSTPPLEDTNTNASHIYNGLADENATTYNWYAAGNNGGNNFIVAQVGDRVFFWTADGFRTDYYLSLGTYLINETVAIPGDFKCQFASGKGKLFVSNPACDPVYVEYDPDTDTLSETRITIEIRDFEGVDDGLEIDERPETYSVEHHYNCKNQGWRLGNALPDESTGSGNLDPFYRMQEDVGVFPSNADIVYLGRRSSDNDAEDIGKFKSTEILKNAFGSTLAPRGGYILNAWTLNRGEKSELAIPNDVTQERPATIAFFAGRAWYAGIPNAKYGTTVFFSQIIENDSNINKCYSSNDPTAEELSDLLATDGGIIPIPEVGQIIKLIPTNEDLIVMSNNGVWAIGSSTGFTATEYSVRKLSSVGVLDAGSIVEAENQIYFWADAGIYRLVPDQITGYLTAENISLSTIQTWYEELPAVAKFRVAGIYDYAEKRVFWYYNPNVTYDDGNSTKDYKARYTKALIFSLGLEAFFPYDFGFPNEGNDGPEGTFVIYGAVMSPPIDRTSLEQTVVDSNDDVVQDSSLEDVIVNTFTTAAAAPKQLVLGSNGTAGDGDDHGLGFMAYENDTDFKDFSGFNDDEEASIPYMETGYFIEGTLNNKSTVYVQPVFKRAELTYTVTGNPTPTSTWDNEAACTIQAKWDWADADDSGKWSDAETAYRLLWPFTFDDGSDGNKSYTGGQTTVKTKLRVRGVGDALQLRYAGESQKDVHLYGWQTILEGVTVT